MSIITVDLIGTLTRYGEFWRNLLKWVRLEGITTYVVCGPWETKAIEMLQGHGYMQGVHYSGVFSVLQHLQDKGFDVFFSEMHDRWVASEIAWWAAKPDICKKLNSRIHFDNDERFKAPFKNVATRFVYTESYKGMHILQAWHDRLKLANTFDDEDWGDEDDWTGMMSGFIPG